MIIWGLECNQVHDVIVVGTGPAGSVLAYLMAKQGLDVLILEKATLPRYKSCGGGVTWKALQNLPYDVSAVLEHKVSGGYPDLRRPAAAKSQGEPACSLASDA